MIGLCIFLICLLIVLWMPCGIYARYSSEAMTAKLFFGPFRINLLRSYTKKASKSATKFESLEKIKKDRKLSDFWPIVRLVFNFLKDFRKSLVIKNLHFKIILAGDDPCELSLKYGRYWALLANLIPHLDSWFIIRKRNLEIECDYLAENTKIDATIDLRMSLFALLRMAFHHGIRILIEYYKISKNAKDGAVS